MIRLFIITGLSGSGKSTAKKCFEDLGYFTIDNLPVPLMNEFVRLLAHTQEGIKNIAMVMDARMNEFIQQLPETIATLKERGYLVELLYFEASDEVLQRRFSETRRKHPLSPNDSPQTGIQREKKVLQVIREKSDLVIDTSKYTSHQLKQFLVKRFAEKAQGRTLALRLSSFGYRGGIPPDADLVFDVRFLPNPFFRDELRDLTGLDKAVRDFVLQSDIGSEFTHRLNAMLDYLVPHYLEEGKAYLHIAIGCTGGRHRSVAIVEMLAQHWQQHGYHVKVEHRDVNLAVS